MGISLPQSDYDIRGVYLDLDPVKRHDALLTQKTHSLDGFTPDRQYDWVFWDLPTFLQFLKAKNTAAIDCLLSTITYRGKPEQDKMKKWFLTGYQTQDYLFHHFGLLKSMYEIYVNLLRKSKRYLKNRQVLGTIQPVKRNLELILSFQ